MMDFCGFFRGKSSEFAWIPDISPYNTPAKKVSNNFWFRSSALQPSNESGFLNLLFEVHLSTCVLGLDCASSVLACMLGVRLASFGASKGAASIPWRPLEILAAQPGSVQGAYQCWAWYWTIACLGPNLSSTGLQNRPHRSGEICGEIFAVTNVDREFH